MILFITGTPGTGKSTVASLLKEKTGLRLIDLNQLINDEELYTGIHEEWKYKIVDLDALCQSLNNIIADLKDQEDLLVEGHLSHFCKGADVMVVLRAHPDILRKRLKNKGFPEKKINENIEAEALDVCAFEAFQTYGDKTNEINTSDKKPEEVADIINKIMIGEEYLPVGQVDFFDYLIT
ncbi:MAG: adenylate kinase family protein [Methanobacterium sp.]|nr:adenylate kinase family protein [Methanobacterium sp.]